MSRQWTLEAAEQLLPEIRLRTERAVAAVDALGPPPEDEDKEAREAFDAEVREHVSRWMREMEAFGVAVQGPWRIDFETAEGAFCWAWPDRRLAFRPRGTKDATPIQ